MFKTARWKENKSRIKSAFKLQFRATQDEGISNDESEMKFLSSRSFPLHADSHGYLKTSHSFGALSAQGSDGKYTPTVDVISNKSSLSDCMCFLSPIRNDATPAELMTGSCEWSGISAPDHGGTCAVANTARLQDSDESVEKLRNDINFLTRKLELSDLELQALRKKVVKESRRGEDLAKEISWLKEEREDLKRKCEELKLSHEVNNYNASDSQHFQLAECNLFSLLEEIVQKLNHEKDTNENLRMQLQKMKEANSKFIFAIRYLDGLLKQRNRELPCTKCGQFKTDEDFQDLEFENEIMNLQKSKCNSVLLDAISETESEEHLLEKKIIALNIELELSIKEKEDMEKHMEQLALDNEILKLENHEISSKLEQKLLHEQLKIQYVSTSHLRIINGLQAQVERFENEIRKQSETFETDLATILRDKVEQEKKALLAEEELTKLRISNANAAILLQEEVKRLSAQLSATFIRSEKLVLQAQKETSELCLQKSQLEQLLAKSNESLAFLQDQYHGKLQQLLGLIEYESKETDRLISKLKDKHLELENYRVSQEAKLNASFEEIQSLKSEIEILKAEKGLLSEQLQKKEKSSTEMED